MVVGLPDSSRSGGYDVACVYKMTFPNGKSYIGMTQKTAEDRFCEHVRAAHRGSGYAVHRALRKHGNDSALLSTLVIAETEYCKDMEVLAIKEFGTKSPQGYNMTSGGDGFTGLSDDAVKRRTDSLKKRLDEPEYYERVCSNLEMVRQDPESEKKRVKSIRKWAKENPEVVNRRLQDLRMDEDVESRRVASLRKRYEDDGVRSRQAAQCREMAKDPKVAEKKSYSSKNMWKDPAHREKFRDAHERRRLSGVLKRNYVYPNKSGSFSVRIRHRGETKNIGTFKTLELAIEARDGFLESVGRRANG